MDGTRRSRVSAWSRRGSRGRLTVPAGAKARSPDPVASHGLAISRAVQITRLRWGLAVPRFWEARGVQAYWKADDDAPAAPNPERQGEISFVEPAIFRLDLLLRQQATKSRARRRRSKGGTILRTSTRRRTAPTTATATVSAAGARQVDIAEKGHRQLGLCRRHREPNCCAICAQSILSFWRRRTAR